MADEQRKDETKSVDLEALRAALERVQREHPDLRRDAGRTIAAIDRRRGRPQKS